MAPRRKPANNLGVTIIRHRAHMKGGGGDHSKLHTTEIDAAPQRPGLQSVIERNDLDEMLAMADLAGREFTAERNAVVVLRSKTDSSFSLLDEAKRGEQRREEEALYCEKLKIPRRPKWTTEMTADELDVLERQSFLEWRRGLASLEDNEKLVITPFEKNLDIWRQLWRVLERSDLIVTVVDARNPLLYRCKDLEVYAQELDSKKRTVLLLNKADLLPLRMRQRWSRYLDSQGLNYLWWSAKRAESSIAEDGHSSQEATSRNPRLSAMAAAQEEEEEEEEGEETKVLGREEVFDRLERMAEAIAKSKRKDDEDGDGEEEEDRQGGGGGESVGGSREGEQAEKRQVVVGFVGYPNVGKSSTINALIGKKRAGVTSTPGKTKHFQTLVVSDTLVLCDCPGLVFPSFTNSRSDMVAAGVLPIDRLTDQRGPVEVVAKQIPRQVLEATYGLVLPLPQPHEPRDRAPTAAELLRAYSRSRNYTASSGLPDETRASRQIMKDYLSGKLLYCYPPQDGEEEEGRRSDQTAIPRRNDENKHINDDVEDEDDEESEDDDDDDEEEEEEEGRKTNSRQERSQAGDGSRNGDGGEEEVVRSSGFDKDLASCLGEGGDSSQRSRQRRAGVMRAPHKMHKKAPRGKDRSWRVGHGGKDDSDGMPLVRGIAKPVSHGAAGKINVTPIC